MKRLITVALILLGLSVTAFAQLQKTLTGEQILTKMLSEYATCNSYSDEGIVEDFIITKERTWTERRPFTTSFVRPSQFYFDYTEQINQTDTWNKYCVWEDQKGLHRWWSLDPTIKPYSNLGLALPVSISRLAAYNIPFLLRADLKRRSHRFQRISDFHIAGEEIVDGRSTYKLVGIDWYPQMNDQLQPVTIWVDKQNSLLLKIHQKLQLQNSKTGEAFEVETTTTYKPQINIEISPDRFKVTIPVAPRKSNV